MDRGSLTSELRRLDSAAGRTPVRAEALAGLAGALAALLDGRVVEHDTKRERAVLAAGARGLVVCVAPARAVEEVAVVHSAAPGAVRALAEQLGVELPRAGRPADGLPRAVAALLVALDAAVAAARDHAAHRLHDGPVQELTAAQLVVESAASLSAADADALRIHRGVELLRGAILSCRQLMADLAGGRPGADA
jgi:signal transduction histidine kinase